MNEITTEEEVSNISEVSKPMSGNGKLTEQNLIDEFKSRETTAFFAMVVIGFMMSSSPYFVYILFLGMALFGAFQLRFMDLVNNLANNSSTNSAKSSVASNSKFGRSLLNGVMGNMVWWVILVVGMFAWQQMKSTIHSDVEASVEGHKVKELTIEGSPDTGN